MSICRILPRVSTSWIAATLAVLVVLSAIGCQNSTSDRDLVYRRPNEAVEMANTPSGAFGAGGLPKVLWLDPRTPAEYAAGHIPQAKNIPFPEIERTHEVSCKGYDMFIVYDTDYDDVMSKAAAKRMIELRYSNVYCILGGLKAWKADGNPVATGN
ncbi:MAG: rhodanese-like domain-containing protein [Planctomycetota bacterium]